MRTKFFFEVDACSDEAKDVVVVIVVVVTRGTVGAEESATVANERDVGKEGAAPANDDDDDIGCSGVLA